MRRIKQTLLLSLALTVTACSSVYDKHVQWQAVEPEAFPTLKAIGQAPISSQRATDDTQKMLMAIKASKLAAYAELAEQVYGQLIGQEVTMQNLIISNQQLTASVHGVIRGAKVVKSYPVGDTYTTELSLDFADVWQIYQTNMRKQEIKDVKYY